MFVRPCKRRFLLFVFGAGIIASSASAQSTLGSINGVVHDTTDADVPGTKIILHRTESNTDRTITSGSDGSYTALNLEPGTYSIQYLLPGFASKTEVGVHLTARQQLTLNVTLSPASVSATVQVDASSSGTITTENASIAATLSPRDVLDLPANYRGAGSTSPLNVIQTLPGIQPDSGAYPPPPSTSPNPSIKFSIQGGLPSQSETTVDGISAQNQTSNNILGDAFPSAESIAEIRVDGVNNNAEFGQPGEITTITKSGSNHLHGSAFWYFQNQAFDAIPYGTDAANKPHKVANDFGGSIGGPVYIPHLYHGQNKTFFFATYEGLRFPEAAVVQYLVPTARMKRGDFSQETSTLRNPFTGGIYPGATLPTINPSSAAFLSLFPDPNVNPNESVQDSLAGLGYNYLSTRPNSIDSNQYDLRVDQNLGQRANFFARYTNKSINQIQPGALALPNGTGFAQYRIFAASFNFAFTPKLANEVRFGFTLEQDGSQNPFDGATLQQAAKLNGLSPTFPFNGLSHLGFTQLTSVGSRLNSTERSRLFQYVDNVTWQHAGHTIRVGGDVRRLNAFTPLGFSPSDNYGNFYFQQTGSYTGNEFADFLVGTPYQTQTDNITTDNNGTATAYAVYAQDNWKATPNLNLTFGIRYELHPAFAASNGEIANFDPSVAKSGRLIYPDGNASLLSTQELANVNACSVAGVTNPYATNASVNGAPCTPVVSNSQAGLPAGLRSTPKLRFEPRFGFAYRPFGNDRTALRGGVGYYNITTSGALFYALTGTLQSNLQTFNNTITPTGPAFVFPNISAASTNAYTGPDYGSTTFYSAVDTNWHDPYSLQTNLSIDHDLGHGFGIRVSYVGLKTWHLVWQPELNMLPYSSTTTAASQPRTAFPFPNFYSIYNRATSAQASYHSGQVELSHRFSKGLSFDSAYTFAKNLADNQGTYGAASGTQSFVDEQGGYDATYTYDRHVDYGNVTGTRRNRWLTSSVYELPIGRGKRFGNSMGHLADLAVGGWQVSNIFVMQSGPFISAYISGSNTDPSGTGSGTLFFRQQRPDRVASGKASHPTRTQWFNPNAFACPGSTGFTSLQNGACDVGGVDANSNPVAPIGRFGTESIGDLTGPGTISLSSGVAKSFHVTETLHLRAEGTFTNILNHTNLADPNLDVTSPGFGTITQARGSDFGGNRTGQVSVKLEF
ncbi:TonB-dependent receptor [Granulicella arctica]|uniref:TonB-dependent receptor n=1 Tax=Granulicella arctica TaxID=940613 RepID=UPI0021DFEFE7|nr:TonB-dependent receptor [Granulicella arctica]